MDCSSGESTETAMHEKTRGIHAYTPIILIARQRNEIVNMINKLKNKNTIYTGPL